VDHGVTGFLRDNLKQAITECLTLDRYKVECASTKFTWENAWEIFKNNLIEV
jgi:hypothetical protein